MKLFFKLFYNIKL